MGASLDVKVLHLWIYGELATIQAKASTDRYRALQEANVSAKMTVSLISLSHA